MRGGQTCDYTGLDFGLSRGGVDGFGWGTLAFDFAQGRRPDEVRPPLQVTILVMRSLFVGCLVILPCCLALAQKKGSAPGGQAVTVPATIDHNRVVISVEIPLADGSTQKVRAWVDNGNPELELSRRLASVLGLAVSCSDTECSAPPPAQLYIGMMAISLAGVKEAKIPLRAVTAAAMLAPGMNVEINLPSSVLRQFDVLVDFPDSKFSIGPPGSIHFNGVPGKVQINAENGLIQVPSQIGGKKYNLALDVGASISFLSEELFDKLAAAHPDWPQMRGAVGSASMWGAEDETKWKVMRVDRVPFGPLFLANVPMASLPKSSLDFFAKRAGMPTVGVLGSNMLVNYRVGLDYRHSTVYFDLGRTYRFPDFDVVGLILRPDEDGGFTILGVADFEGKPSVTVGPDGVQPGDRLLAVGEIPAHGSTMGQVWSMLGGTPGQERKLTIERAGKQFVVAATVRHFLPEVPDEELKRR